MLLALVGVINFGFRAYMFGLLAFLMGVKIYGIILEFKHGIEKFKSIGINEIR